MSVLTDPLAQIEAAVSELEARVNVKVADAEKKSQDDVPTAEELSRLTALIEKIKSLPH